jgi:hypothetical protein
MGLLANGSMDKRFFHRLGASKVDSSTLCAGTSGAAWDTVFGDAGGIDFEELTAARLIIVWGNNVTTCNLHPPKSSATHRRTVQAGGDRSEAHAHRQGRGPAYPPAAGHGRRAGLRRRAPAGSLRRPGPGLYRPRTRIGANAFLAAARDFPLERAAQLCGVDAALIEQFAELLRRQRPAAMSIGVGPERNRNGSAGLRAAFSLMALTGNIGPRGAGICDTSRYFPVDGTALARPDLAPEACATLNVMDIPRYVLEPGDETAPARPVHLQPQPGRGAPGAGRMREALLSETVLWSAAISA